MKVSNRFARTVVSLGAGRGAARIQPHIAKYDAHSQPFRLDQHLVDKVPGKAMVLAERGSALGVRTSYTEARGEHYLTRGGVDELSPIHDTIDDAKAHEAILKLGLPNPLFINTILDIPGLGPTGLRLLLTPGRNEERETYANLFHRLSEFSAAKGTRHVFGAAGAPVNRLIEDRYRAWFAEHFRDNIGKVIHGLEPEAAPAEVTFDGRDTSPLVVFDSSDGWRTGDDLLTELLASLPVPVRPGTNFAIAELGTDGIRFHRARLRATDGRLVLLRTPRRYQGGAPRAEAVPEPHATLNRLRAAILAD